MHLHTLRKNHTPENKEINLVTAAFHPAKQSQETESFLKTREQFVELLGWSACDTKADKKVADVKAGSWKYHSAKS